MYAIYAVLTVLILLSGVHWTGYFMNIKYNALLTGASPVSPGKSSSGFNIEELLSYQLFGKADSAQEIVPRDLPLSSLNLKLTGVVASDRGGFALISVNGQPQAPYFIGEEILPGTVLDAVLDDRVILNRNGTKESLVLEDRAPGAAGHPVTAKRPKPEPLPYTQSVQQTGSNRFAIEKAKLATSISDPKLLRQALIVPNPDGGFVVKNIQRGSVFEKLGLHTGDVIRKVNSLNINSMVDVMQLYRLTGDMDKINSLTVEVERNGNTEQLHYNLR